MSLPVVQTAGDLAIVDPSTGEAISLRDASDHTLLDVAQQVQDEDKQRAEIKRALAFELKQRHGVGTSHAGGFGFKVAESKNWGVKATEDALHRLVNEDRITLGEANRCLPNKPKPDGRQLASLLGRLLTEDPDAAKVLAEACTTSPASVRDVVRESVNAETA